MALYSYGPIYLVMAIYIWVWPYIYSYGPIYIVMAQVGLGHIREAVAKKDARTKKQACLKKDNKKQHAAITNMLPWQRNRHVKKNEKKHVGTHVYTHVHAHVYTHGYTHVCTHVLHTCPTHGSYTHVLHTCPTHGSYTHVCRTCL